MEMMILNRDTTTSTVKRAWTWVGSGYEEGPKRPGSSAGSETSKNEVICTPLWYMSGRGISRAS